MDEIILDEFLFNESLFDRIQSLSPFSFFDTVHPLKMDELLKVKYGERLVFHKYLKVDLDTIALFIVSEYQNKWNNILVTIDSDIKNGSERVLSEDTSNKVLTNGSNITENKVSAFNSDELITDKKDIDDNSSNTDNLENKLLTEKQISLNTAFNNLSISCKINIINIVLKDIASYLTLDIYP